jgi:hypothetical protein
MCGELNLSISHYAFQHRSSGSPMAMSSSKQRASDFASTSRFSAGVRLCSVTCSSSLFRQRPPSSRVVLFSQYTTQKRAPSTRSALSTVSEGQPCGYCREDSVFMDTQCSYYDHSYPMHISILTALLEFGKKYGVRHLQDEAEVSAAPIRHIFLVAKIEIVSSASRIPIHARRLEQHP